MCSAWLAKLSPDGWEGTVSELEHGLWTIGHRDPVPTFIPRRNGVGRRIAAERNYIEACGCVVEFRRTKRERTLWFTRRG